MNDGLYGFHPETTAAAAAQAAAAALVAEVATTRLRLITSNQTVVVPANVSRVRVVAVGGGGGYGVNGVAPYGVGATKGTAGGTTSVSCSSRFALTATGGGFGDGLVAPHSVVQNGGPGGIAEGLYGVTPGESISCTVGAGGSNGGGGGGTDGGPGAAGSGSGGQIHYSNNANQFVPYSYGAVNGNQGAVRLEFY